MNLKSNISASPQNCYNEVKPMPRGDLLSKGMTSFLPLILIVEDDDDTRIMMKYLLTLWGYEIIEAIDGEEGFQMAENYQPEVILMDYSLPKSDGLAVTRQIRELAHHGKTPIIFISAHTEAAVRESALAAGANDFLTKPVDFGQLEKALNTHSKNRDILKQQIVEGVL